MYREAHKLKIHFSKDAADYLIDESQSSGKTIRTICEKKFADYQFGLKLIAKNTSTHEFEISKAMAENPDDELSAMVAKSYEK